MFFMMGCFLAQLFRFFSLLCNYYIILFINSSSSSSSKRYLFCRPSHHCSMLYTSQYTASYLYIYFLLLPTITYFMFMNRLLICVECCNTFLSIIINSSGMFSSSPSLARLRSSSIQAISSSCVLTIAIDRYLVNDNYYTWKLFVFST